MPPLRPVKNGSKIRSTACRLDPGAAVGDLEDMVVLVAQSGSSLISTPDAVAGLAVLDAVVAQVPDRLMQVAGIETYLELVRLLLQSDLRGRHLHGLGEFDHELLEPVGEVKRVGSRGFAARELQARC